MNNILTDLEEAIKLFNVNRNQQNLTTVLAIIIALLKGESFIYMPVGVDSTLIERMKKEGTLDKDSLHLEKGANFQLRSIVTDDGKSYLPCFTNKKYYRSSPMTALMFSNLKDYLMMAQNTSGIDGVVINPFDNPMLLTNNLIKDLLEEYEKNKVKNYS